MTQYSSLGNWFHGDLRIEIDAYFISEAFYCNRCFYIAIVNTEGRGVEKRDLQLKVKQKESIEKKGLVIIRKRAEVRYAEMRFPDVI